MRTQVSDVKVEGFERVVEVHNDSARLFGYIAIHNTKLGPGLGGIRFKEYGSNDEALTDVCGLARAMTNKNSLANINYGGGKAVIRKNAHYGLRYQQERVELYKAMGEAVEQLRGSYIACEDVGTVTQDLYSVLETTKHCSGTQSDSGIATAAGLFHVFETYCNWEEISFDDITVSLAGLGKVGWCLAENLYAAGVSLKATDIVGSILDKFVAEHENTYRSYASIAHQEPCEVYSPCALGGIVNRVTRRELNCNAIIGSANNQLDMKETDRFLHKRGVTYFPDYLVNAGGVIALAAELDEQMENLSFYLEMMGDRTHAILSEAECSGRSMLDVVEDIVAERLGK